MTVDLNLWLSNILKRFPLLSKSSLPDSLEHLKNVLRIIVFSVHVSVPITSTNWVEYITKAIETVSTTDNVLFYSTNQLPAFKSTDPKFDKLILWGGYGTGKSLLLREKALQLSRQDPSFHGRIMYVHCNLFDNNRSLQVSYLKNMLEPHGIIVKSFVPKRSSLCVPSLDSLEITEDEDDEDLTEMVTKNNIKAIFLDEWKIFPKEEIEKMISLVEICWIAPGIEEYCYDARNISQELRMNFEFLDLKLNLRNSRKIVETSMMLNQEYERETSYDHAGITLPPQNFPCGQPSVFADSLEKAIAMARKFTKGGILVITAPDDACIETFMQSTGEKWKLNSDLTETEDPYKLLTEGYILFVNCCKNVTGFEWPVVICTPYDDITISLEGINYHRRNIFMRCTTYLIVISKRQTQY
ncbi:uncharacterized protein [Clytia hemisphaerica]|uniref:Uncharacterized protein n=2 Tax=Clytia hemisphaerica TaxID=252671 RepID=A0A7M5UV30_9CNID